MHEVGEESRRRSYATVILTVDATLNMYMRRAGNAIISDCPETGASNDSYVLDITLERLPSRTPRSFVRRTKKYLL